jgi:hypothetical protein
MIVGVILAIVAGITLAGAIYLITHPGTIPEYAQPSVELPLHTTPPVSPGAFSFLFTTPLLLQIVCPLLVQEGWFDYLLLTETRKPVERVCQKE